MSTPIDYDAMPHTGYRDCCPRCAEDAFEEAERAYAEIVAAQEAERDA